MIIIGLLFAFWAIWHMWTHTTLQDGWKMGINNLARVNGLGRGVTLFSIEKTIGGEKWNG